MKKCTIITTKELIKLIKQDEDKEDLFILESTDMNH